MLELRMATESDFEKIKDFYVRTIKAMENSKYKPQWTIGVYPSYEYLKEAVDKGEMLIGILDGEYVAAMIINNEYNDGFDKAAWNVDAKKGEITVPHAFGVHPSMHGNGIGKKMMEKAISIAKENNQKAIRLDVIGGNLPAARFYEKIGCKYIDTVKLFYEDTGLTDFMLYEYVL